MKDVNAKSVLVLMVVTFFLSVQLLLIQAVRAQEDKVTIGLNVPLSGSYKAQGQDQEMAYKLVIDRINAGGGALGKKIGYVLKDTKTDPEVAKQNAVELIRQHGAVMVSGGSSSAVAIAQCDVCQENGVIFMAGLTHSNATTGHDITKAGFRVQKAHRHTFRWFFNAWMTGKTLAPFLLEKFGEGKEYFYITADYTWGSSLERNLRWYLEGSACDTAGSVLVPLGKKDFRKELAMAEKADPDVLVLVLFGQDLITSLKQAQDMGLKKKMEIVVPLMELNMAHGAGPEAMEGVISTVNWYWGLRDRFEGSKVFVDAFRSKYGKAPGSAAACAWVAVNEWVSAVKRAGGFAPDKIIKALEGHKFTLLKDQEEWRDWDHQAISSVFITEGKSKKESKDEWDLLKIIGEKKGTSVMRNREENPVTLERLASEK
jgi:branched-chain amino acid transport system substrate-binding protein